MSASWNGYPVAHPSRQVNLGWRNESLPPLQHATDTLLPYAQGRSYGDVCQNNNATLLHTKNLNHFISFDREQGKLRAESGVTIAQVLELIVPQGWFVPVTPGTAHVSLGGALANDVHGKNHHRVGSFGNHVLGFELLRSDGSRHGCTRDQNTAWYQATLGGLGLTGLVTEIELQLMRIASVALDTETVQQRDLQHFIALSEESAATHEYTVAWIDCLAHKALGKGLFMRANHASVGTTAAAPRQKLTIPCYAPSWLLNTPSLKAFNSLYYNINKKTHATAHYASWLYPLDSLSHWNRLYGRKGFIQYQCVVPHADALEKLLITIAEARQGSFLAVLKKLGTIPSQGLLSFCRPGFTLALDFPMRGERTWRLLNQLDDIVLQHQGCIYLAKDARLSAATFQQCYPQWTQLEALRDPHFSSSLWRRLTGKTS